VKSKRQKNKKEQKKNAFKEKEQKRLKNLFNKIE